ncbi:hypothetical protein AKJ48_01565 [candidate division MSBL1 archaeon SCGC-AAA261O19]|uniref:Uncharacterized protein n=1 Tax=candidate division MSBL1 archaeon SCGC-AAA261O19 TaxID=1698277 RepID=A0A133VE51_9EURY|nr:hypothetical protein AKJ48_01565 [candidate division MSBL1 archaeon SCGC-AAA261O19]
MKIGFFVVSTELGGQLELGEEIHSEVREILSEISQKLKISGLIITSEMAEKRALPWKTCDDIL